MSDKKFANKSFFREIQESGYQETDNNNYYDEEYLDYDDGNYDYDYDYNWRANMCVHIAPGNKENIIYQLDNLPDFRYRNYLGPIMAGIFYINLSPIADSNYIYEQLSRYKSFNISIAENGDNYVAPSEDYRFQNKSWAKKFNYSSGVLDLNELVDLILHGIRLEKLSAMI